MAPASCHPYKGPSWWASRSAPRRAPPQPRPPPRGPRHVPGNSVDWSVSCYLLSATRRGGRPPARGRRRGGHATSQEIPSIGLFHVISFRLPAACAARPILVLLRRPPRLAILTQRDRARHLAAIGGSGELA